MKRTQILFLLSLCIIFFPKCEKQNLNPNKAWKIIIPDTLSYTRISSICEYKDSSIWIGTNDGILVYDNNSMSSITTDDGLLDNVVLDIKKNSKNELIIFTLTGINHYDGVMHEVNIDRINYRQYKDFDIDPYDNIWLLSENSLLKFNNDTSISYFPARTVGYYGYDSESYTCVFADSKGKIWVGYYYTDIALFSIENDKIDYYDPQKISYLVASITEDNDGNIWVTSGFTNLVRINGQNYTSYHNEKVFWFYRNSLIADHNNDIWIVTVSRVVRLHNEKWVDEYVYFDASYGEPHDEPFVEYSGIMEDSMNNIWVFTDRGVMMKENH
jgi:ligand-binding sensor domain-containing protein